MRHQQFGFRFRSGTTVVRSVLILLIALFIFFAIAVRTNWGSLIFNSLALSPDLVFEKGYVWQLFTYAFLHDIDNPFHLIFNGLLFFFIGPELEARWGEKRFVIFIAATALGGAFFVCAAWWLGISEHSVIGFSSVCLGLLIAWGITYAHRSIYLLGIIPVTGQVLVWLTLGFEVLYAVSSNAISSAAHFGGMAAGAVLTLGIWRPSRFTSHVQRLIGRKPPQNRWQ